MHHNLNVILRKIKLTHKGIMKSSYDFIMEALWLGHGDGVSVIWWATSELTDGENYTH
jgi:hypothetical protein